MYVILKCAVYWATGGPHSAIQWALEAVVLLNSYSIFSHIFGKVDLKITKPVLLQVFLVCLCVYILCVCVCGVTIFSES